MPSPVVATTASFPSSPVALPPPPPENECLVTGAPVAIHNDASASPATRTSSRHELNARKNLILDQLRDSTDPTAPQLAAMLKDKLRHAPDAATREAIIACYEKELSKPVPLLPTLKDFFLNAANSTLPTCAWRLASHALPGITGAASAAQVARALYEGDWRAISAALPSLLPFLPALRSVDSIEAFIRSLPPTVVETLQSMHDWVQRADDAITLDLGIEEAGGALAAAVLLWQLQRRLPTASGHRQGVGQFVANLPHHWRKLVSLNGLGGQLFAPVGEGPGPMRGLDRKEMVAFKRVEDRKHLAGYNETAPVPHRLASARSSAPQVPVLDLQKARAPQHVATPGPIADSPLDALYAASSPASRAEAGWLKWLGAMFTCLGARAGFNQVATEVPGIELHVMESGQFVVPAADPASASLLGSAPKAATTSLLAGMGNFIKQNPVKATMVTTGTFAAASVAWVKDTIWPTEVPPPTLEQLALLLSQEVVSVDGAWGSGVDQLLGTLEVPGKRRRRHALEQTNSTGSTSRTTQAPSEQTRVQGLTDAQRDQMLGDAQLTDTLRSMQAWALALAQDIGQQDGWTWVASLVGSEQELVVTQLRQLQELEPVLTSLEALPLQLLDNALKQHGHKSGSAGLQVDLGSTTVAGVNINEKMPLLEYCLTRAGSSTSPVRITRDGKPLHPSQQELLQGFLTSNGCQQLPQQVDERSKLQQPALVKALRARLVIDALKAKFNGALGSGPDAHRRGADIVLGYLQGAQDVESSLLTYSDVLADGSRVEFTVPHYLVLRSASKDSNLNGQVVLYRADLQKFDVFKDENAFRQFLDERRAKGGLHVINNEIDKTLVQDIIAAAPLALRPKVQEQVQRWQERQAAFQNGKQGTATWNAGDSFLLDFKPVSDPGHALDDWAAQRIQFAQQEAQQQLASNRLRWSTLGIANAATDADHAEHLNNDVQTLQDHAKPALTTELVNALKLVGIDFKDLDPDRMLLTVQGVRMSLTDWAVSGWQRQGLMRPPLPVNLPDLPGFEGGLPNQRQELEPWPSQIDLFDMDLTVQKADASGTPVTDAQRTDQLLDEDARRAVIRVLADMAQSNELADAYVAHLKDVAKDASNGLHASMANHIRVHMLWMIESAHQQGRLDAAAYAALKRAHGQLEGTRKGPSSLQVVQIKGHDIQGLWALSANNTQYVFVPGTSAGDQLLDEAAFKRWLLEPEAQDYVLARAPLRLHEDLNKAFNAKQSAKGIAVTFGRTGGPWQAGKSFIDMRISDVDEMTTSQLERMTDALTIFGSIVAGLTCTIGTGGTMAAVCIGSTLGMVARGIHSGVKALKRGNIDEAIEEIGTSVADALDVLGMVSLPLTLWQLGRKGLSTVNEAIDALAQWRRQAQAFTGEGHINPAFVTSRLDLSEAGLPMLERRLADGTKVHWQDGHEYIEQAGSFVKVQQQEGEHFVRLDMQDGTQDAGPPIKQQAGQWKRMEAPDSKLGVTTLRPLNSPRETPPQRPEWINKLPEKDLLPEDKLDELAVVFGSRSRESSPSADIRRVVREATIEQRVQEILTDPTTLGKPGDESIIMRAWADSPKLGNGKCVETFIDTLGEWTRGARFGTGPVGLMVKVPDARTLPDIDALINASDIEALLGRLRLPSTTGRDELVKEVIKELGSVIQKNPQQSIQTWQRWLAVQHRLPAAADNLKKHFPELTKDEAEDIVNSANAVQKQELESWIFNPDIRDKVSDKLRVRNERQHREAVFKNRFQTLADVQQLGSHLQGVLQGRTTRVLDDNAGGFILTVSGTTPGDAVAKLTFTPDDKGVLLVKDGSGAVHPNWQSALFPQLSATEQTLHRDATQLRQAVLANMQQAPIKEVCTLSSAAAGSSSLGIFKSKTKKRAPECDPTPSITLVQEDVDQREALMGVLDGAHGKFDAEYDQLALEELELKQLQKQALALKPEKLDDTSLARMRELERKPFGNLKGLDTMNLASYRMQGLYFNDESLEFLPDFPLEGTAVSGNARPLFSSEGLIEGAPVRRVFVPEADAVNNPTFSNWYRDDYALGADLAPITGRYGEGNQASKKITLKEVDLRVTKPGSKAKVPVYELDEEEILKLDSASFSPNLRSIMGDSHLLPSNAKSLRPGDYRVYGIRSCSEGKWLDGFFRAVSSKFPSLSARLWGSFKGPVTEMKGKMYMMSDMDPCLRSCDRRFAELKSLMPNMQFRVFYVFDDNAHRKQWLLEKKLEAIINKNRDAWENAGVGESEMRALAETDLLKPEVAQWVDAEFKRNPPQPPVARLWVPEEPEAF